MAARNIAAAKRYASDEARWIAVKRRDAGADGVFWFSVKSTGVYCRPSCAARLPLRTNVAFHDSPAAARAAGFRACLRCRPDGPSRAERDAAAVAQACRLIEAAETPPELDALAAAAGLSRFHFHRVFRRVAGMTPRQYAQAHRAERVRRDLPARASVTEAIYDAGFNSSANFYADAPGALGMTPSRYRSGGRGERIRFAVGQTSLGALLVATTGQGVAAIRLGDDADALVRELQQRFPNAELVGDDPDFDRLVATVAGLVEAPAATVDLPLDVRGSAFQHRVWHALRQIPPGSTASYREIAERIGAPSASRAVARACASNPVAVAIPCHRVVRSDGDLSGYRWGVERKAALLARERAAVHGGGA
ncbi:MAG: bifunctional DNA-binding transcriptional regulator/O6-methylguanine-DNA methyltransferase Ada [Lautropia sp.]